MVLLCILCLWGEDRDVVSFFGFIGAPFSWRMVGGAGWGQQASITLTVMSMKLVA
jgi:hypothetical protein